MKIYDSVCIVDLVRKKHATLELNFSACDVAYFHNYMTYLYILPISFYYS